MVSLKGQLNLILELEKGNYSRQTYKTYQYKESLRICHMQNLINCPVKDTRTMGTYALEMISNSGTTTTKMQEIFFYLWFVKR